MRPLRHARSVLIGPIRFDEPLEAEYLADLERAGRRSRSELWLGMLVLVTVVLVFNQVFLDVPREVMPLGRLLILGVMIPMLLRWLSGDRSPLRRWSSLLFIASAYIDVACMMILRVACLDHGIDVVPIVLPVAVLMSLIVVQIRFVLLAPAILLGLAELIAIELTAFAADSNRLFAITAAVAMVAVSLGAAYDHERWTRIDWLRRRELDALARTDPLTGLANRRHFTEVMSEAGADGLGASLMILDIDRFKSYNDHFGHPAGDRCLRAVGDHLTSTVGSDGLVARLGGEEFAVVWTDGPQNVGRADRLRGSISRVVLEPAARIETTITASAGLASVRGGFDPNELIARADSALYTAKRLGRDQLVVATEQRPHALHMLPGAVVGPRDGGPAPHPTARLLRFEPVREAEFRLVFEAEGRGSRQLIMIGLLGVIALLLVFQGPLLKIPPEADRLGRLTLVCGLTPGAVIALVGNSLTRLHRWAPQLYILGVAVILAAQMTERAIQLPRGYDVVPLIMPLSVLLSLTVVQIRFTLLAPAAVLGLAGIVTAELALFPWTSNRLLEVGVCVAMSAAALRFSYELERSRRDGWRIQRELDGLTRVDSLTGLANRRHFDHAVPETLHEAARQGRPIVLMFLDIDYFKSYNDSLGHPIGDECLRAVGEFLGAAVVDCAGVAARLGGEEFALIWIDTDGAGLHRAEWIRYGISELRVPARPNGRRVTASAGIVIAPVDAAPSDIAARLQAQADAALYTAKNRGRNCSCITDLQPM